MLTLRALGPLALAAALTACATPLPLPVAQRICVDIPQETPHEVAYAMRKAAQYLAERDFTLAVDACDARISYLAFGHFQADTITARPFWLSRSGYWSQEGMLTVEHQGMKVLEDYPVDLRGYATKQLLLDDLAWAVVRPATWLFQPAASPPRR